MTRRLLTGNGAAAWGARLARADYVPAFPITPQTEIIETLGLWIDRGEMPARMMTLAEISITACIVTRPTSSPRHMWCTSYRMKRCSV